MKECDIVIVIVRRLYREVRPIGRPTWDIPRRVRADGEPLKTAVIGPYEVDVAVAIARGDKPDP